MGYTGHGIVSKTSWTNRAGGRVEATDYIRAMQKLATTLEKGTVGKGI